MIVRGGGDDASGVLRIINVKILLFKYILMAEEDRNIPSKHPKTLTPFYQPEQ